MMINAYPQKGVATFLSIAKAMPHRKFVLIESWPLTHDLEQALTRSLMTLPNVTLLRRVADIGEILDGSSILLAPSKWEEGLGMVALEAAASGVPVIATNIGGLPESVGRGGILIDPSQDTAHWCTVIDDLLDDDYRYRQLSEIARRESCLPEFSLQSVLAQFWRIVDMVPPDVARL